MKKTPIYTTVRLSTDTYNKLHYLSEPFETKDDAMNRILTDYPNMTEKIRRLEEMIVKNRNG